MVWELKSRVDNTDYDTKARTYEGNFYGLIKKVQKTDQDIDHQSSHKNKNNKRNCLLKASDKEYKDTDDGLEKGKYNNKTPQGKQD